VGERGAVLVVPLAPAPTGNGLAMRAGLLLEALRTAGPVDVVVVPVSGPADGGKWLARRARQVLVVDPDPPQTRAEVVARLSDPAQRFEWMALEVMPPRVRLAPPSAATAVAVRLADRQAAAVVVQRSYLAPFGLTLAGELGVRRVVVDLDDDDEDLLRRRGDERAAAKHALLVREWVTRADRVVAASPVDAAAISARHGIDVATLPNAVRRPRTVTEPPGRDRLLFVGNLTYAPNVDAVRDLVLDVLPAVRAQVPTATVDVVGAHDERLADLTGADGVHFAGAVDDLGPWYAGADVAVIPLREGSGTRIKVLEAFAHRRPVVATPAAVAGLDVVDGRSVHLGADGPALATLAARLLRDPARARRTVEQADVVLDDQYLLDVVVPRARRLLID
jgi:glycosyltransferase involved in cell wall biosynthesis